MGKNTKIQNTIQYKIQKYEKFLKFRKILVKPKKSFLYFGLPGETDKNTKNSEKYSAKFEKNIVRPKKKNILT